MTESDKRLGNTIERSGLQLLSLPEFRGLPEDLIDFTREREFLDRFWADSNIETDEFQLRPP